MPTQDKTRQDKAGRLEKVKNIPQHKKQTKKGDTKDRDQTRQTKTGQENTKKKYPNTTITRRHLISASGHCPKPRTHLPRRPGPTPHPAHFTPSNPGDAEHLETLLLPTPNPALDKQPRECLLLNPESVGRVRSYCGRNLPLRDARLPFQKLGHFRLCRKTPEPRSRDSCRMGHHHHRRATTPAGGHRI